MVYCNPSSTPIDNRTKLSSTANAVVADPTEYHSFASVLQCLTLTRPDISHAIQQVSLYMHDPREPHLNLVKWILWYIKGTLDYGL